MRSLKKPYEGGVIPVLGYLRYYKNLKKLRPSVLVSKDLYILTFSTFRAFSCYFTMRSLNCFGQVVLEILDNN